MELTVLVNAVSSHSAVSCLHSCASCTASDWRAPADDLSDCAASKMTCVSARPTSAHVPCCEVETGLSRFLTFSAAVAL